MTPRLFTPLLLIITLAAKTALAQDGLARCDLVAAGPGEAAFLAFDKELRSALSSGDAAALALLVRFPLRVTFSDGAKISLHDPATVQLRFEEVFPPPLRAVVMNQKPRAVFCRYDGIMYGRGALWIDLTGEGKAARFTIASVNVPSTGEKTANGVRRSPGPQVVFTCNADKHRIIVDVSKAGDIRYRSWNKPRSVTEKPDMVVAAGNTDVEGTSPCTHSIWTFKRGDATFVVSELGCTEGKPPAGAIGTLEVLLDGKQGMEGWCY
jgi:hypothetical protein